MEEQAERSLLERLFYLEGGEWKRVFPFFLLYLGLFMGLTLADGLSLALFVQKLGAARLPGCYALTAVLNLFGVAAYLWSIRSLGSVRVFQGILLGSAGLYLLVWGLVRLLDAGNSWFILLFVGREMAYTLVLMHFGNYLLDFFQPLQLRRVLPIIYAGGRVGGIGGGAILQVLPGYIEPIDLVLLFVVLFGVGVLAIGLLAKTQQQSESPTTDDQANESSEEESAAASSRAQSSGQPSSSASVTPQDSLEQAATESVRGFLNFVWRAPVMFWITIVSILFVVCRWLLNFQYSSQFETHFADAASMTRFLGQYTQLALLFSLVLQLLLVNRLVSWIGLRGAHFLYGGLLFAAFMGNLMWVAFPLAVFSRFVEAELRFGLRNPVNQMILNQFPKSVRVPVRAWTLGVLIPLATLLTAGLLARLPDFGGMLAIAWLGVVAGACYLLASLKLFQKFRDPIRKSESSST